MTSTDTTTWVVLAGDDNTSPQSPFIDSGISYDANTDVLTVTGAAVIGTVRIDSTAAGEIDTSSGNLILDSATGTTQIDDNLTLAGDIAVNGGDITTNQATFTIGNTATTAQTLNLGNAATAAATTKTVNLGTGGAASSTTNVNIGASAGGTTTISSPTVSVTGTLSVADKIEHNGDTDTYISFTTDTITFVNGNTQDLIINSAGEVIVGSATDNGAYEFQVNGSQFITGDLFFSSDERLKNKIEKVESGSILDGVLSTDIWKFEYKSDVGNVKLGLMAQDFERNFPGISDQLVEVSEDPVSGLNDRRTIREGKLVYVLWQALKQESSARKALEERISKLEGRNKWET